MNLKERELAGTQPVTESEFKNDIIIDQQFIIASSDKIRLFVPYC